MRVYQIREDTFLPSRDLSRAEIEATAPDRRRGLLPKLPEGVLSPSVKATLWPRSGEGVMSWSRPDMAVKPPGRGAPVDSASEPEKARKNRARASSRARARVRRYAIENRCTRLVTLTYATAQFDREAVVADIAAFIRRLQRKLGRFPWVWCIELHPGGHGCHVHLAVGRFIPKELIAKAWKRGFVHVKSLSKGPRGNKGDASRRAGEYVAKHVGDEVTKQIPTVARPKSAHAYDCAQGCQPRVMVERFRTFDDAEAWLLAMMGSAAEVREASATFPDWDGPPVVMFRWARGADLLPRRWNPPKRARVARSRRHE